MKGVRVPCSHRPQSRAGEPARRRPGRLCGRRRGVAADRPWRRRGPALPGPAGRRAGQRGRHDCRGGGSPAIFRGARSRRPGNAWPVALAMYLVGTLIGTASWLRGQDPFPGHRRRVLRRLLPGVLRGGPGLRSAPGRCGCPGSGSALDSTIFVVGFGAFFWLLVIRPAARQAEIDFLTQALSQGYLALNCVRPARRSGCCC